MACATLQLFKSKVQFIISNNINDAGLDLTMTEVCRPQASTCVTRVDFCGRCSAVGCNIGLLAAACVHLLYVPDCQ
jgi:hypothetical protein